jgi:hypothetical protein
MAGVLAPRSVDEVLAWILAVACLPLYDVHILEPIRILGIIYIHISNYLVR